MISEDIEAQARRIIEAAITKGARITTAESCTGGLVAAALTAIPGSSAAFERGFVTYSNAAKTEMLSVDAQVIEANGAVSKPVAEAMAVGALARSNATIAVSVTGIAGPGGGSAEKPVGRVHFAAVIGTHLVHREMHYGDLGRDAIRKASVVTALDLLEAMLADLPQPATP